MPDPVAVPPDVAEQARKALAERARTAGITGASRRAVMCAMELSQAPFVPAETLELVGAWHAANPHATTPDGRCTRLAGLYGGAAGKRWARDYEALPTTSWLSEESATLEAFPQAWPDDRLPARQSAASTGGAMIALFPDNAASLAVDGGDLASELHVTLAFLGDDATALAEADIEAARAAAAYAAGVRSEPLTLKAIGAGCLGDSDPPATVLILQQADGDGTDHQDGVSAVAAAVRAELNDYGSEGWPAEHDGFIPHLTLGYGVPLEAAQALVGQKITFSQGPTLVVAGARETQPWTTRPAAPAQAAAITADPLRAMSEKAQRARDRLEERLMAAAQVAMRDAVRRAGVKVTQRASRRSNAAKAAVAAAKGKWTPAVLAAVGMTEADLIRQAFDSLGERYEGWVLQAAKDQLRAVADVLGIPQDEMLARMQLRMDSVASAATLRLNEDLTRWAYRLLAEPEPTFGDIGEVPVDPTLPRSILQRSLALADGRTAEAPYGDGLLLEAWLTYDPDAPIEVVTWECGAPARPFPPHHDLCGTVTEWADYAGTFGADAGSFPRGETYWFPGDHDGCECDYSFDYRAARGAA